jgi:hypothetical protein
MRISTRAGAHRFSWDLHYDPIAAPDPAQGGGDDAIGAVPHRTYPDVNAPWAPPGAYTVRLTVDGKRYTQPLALRLDPRVRTSAADLARSAALSREMYDGAKATHAAYTQARALMAQLDKSPGGGSDVAAFRAQVDSVSATLGSASAASLAAAMAMQSADVAPTANQVAAAERARVASRVALTRWNALVKAAGQRIATP